MENKVDYKGFIDAMFNYRLVGNGNMVFFYCDHSYFDNQPYSLAMLEFYGENYTDLRLSQAICHGQLEGYGLTLEQLTILVELLKTYKHNPKGCEHQLENINDKLPSIGES
jgi:hypothetical protein